MNRCYVIFKKRFVFVIAAGKTVEEWTITAEPFFKVSLPVEPALLGGVVLLALDANRLDWPQSELQEVGKRLLDFTGYRSWKALETSARQLTVNRRESEVIVCPQRYDKGSYLPLHERAGKAPLSAEAIGQLLIEKVEECE